MKKSKTTLANLSGLSALRLARESSAPAAPIKTEESPPAKRRARRMEVKLTETIPITPVTYSGAIARPVGRPKTGKRSNEEYRNVTVYIRKDTHADTDEILRRRRRKGLVTDGEPSDVSELVQFLLVEWLDAQNGK